MVAPISVDCQIAPEEIRAAFFLLRQLFLMGRVKHRLMIETRGVFTLCWHPSC